MESDTIVKDLGYVRQAEFGAGQELITPTQKYLIDSTEVSLDKFTIWKYAEEFTFYKVEYIVLPEDKKEYSFTMSSPRPRVHIKSIYSTEVPAT